MKHEFARISQFTSYSPADGGAGGRRAPADGGAGGRRAPADGGAGGR